jgi:molybdenum-dependent DNA-binding transcriptional regulator ModE
MQLVALKYFVAVADHGSFTAAAEWLGVSASTLTRSVSTLEDNLGLTLFERSSRGVALAPAAAPVLAETKRMLASMEAVTEAAGGVARGKAGDRDRPVSRINARQCRRQGSGRFRAITRRGHPGWTYRGSLLIVNDGTWHRTNRPMCTLFYATALSRSEAALHHPRIVRRSICQF